MCNRLMKQNKRTSKRSLFIVLILLLIFLCTACNPDSLQTKLVQETKTETIQETRAKTPEELVEERMAYYQDWPEYDWENLTQEGLFQCYQDDNYTSEIVVDLSKVQWTVDWEEMQEGGIHNCILKVGARGYSEGGLLEDSRFETHYQDAVSAGMNVLGVYFFSQALNEEEAEEEAAFVLEKLHNCQADQDLMVFYDLETEINYASGKPYRNYDLTDQEIKQNLDAFAQCLKKEGYATGVYTNLKWHNRHLSRKLFKGYPLWFAGYTDQPDIHKGFFLWQYTGVAHVKGSHQRLDLNMMLIPKK